MMRIVNLRNEIGERQLQLMGPEPTRLCARRQTVALPEEQKDIRGLANDKVAGSEKRRREWRARDRLPSRSCNMAGMPAPCRFEHLATSA
jgi:hypothetical protein